MRDNNQQAGAAEIAKGRKRTLGLCRAFAATALVMALVTGAFSAKPAEKPAGRPARVAQEQTPGEPNGRSSRKGLGATGAGGLLYITGAGSYAPLSLGSSGQCVGSNGTIMIWESCGLPPSWTVNGTTNSITAQPASGQDAVTLQLEPNVASPAADVFQVYEAGATPTTTCATNAKCAFAVQANGNLFMLGNVLTLGGTTQSTASAVNLYGGVAVQPYVKLGSAAINAPAQPSIALASGGSLPASTTYTIEMTYVNAAGETTVSPASSAVSTPSTCPTSGTCEITVTSPAAETSATGYNIYASTGGAYAKANTTAAAIGTNYTFSATATGSAPPGANTTGDAINDYLSISAGAAGVACVGTSIPGADCTPGTTLVTQASGAPTTGDCVKWTGPNQIGDQGAACGSGGGSGYSTVENAGTALTQRSTVNFGGGLVAADNSASARTDVHLPTVTDIANGTAQVQLTELFTTAPISTSSGYNSGVTTYSTAGSTSGCNTGAAIYGAGEAGLPAQPANFFGAWTVISGAASGNDCSAAAVYNGPALFPALTSTAVTVDLAVRLQEVANDYHAVGIAAPSATNAPLLDSGTPSGIWCDVTDTASAGTWACHTANGTSVTNVTLSPAETADTNVHVLRIVASSSSVTFYWDGTSVGSSTTNLPTTGLTPVWEAKTNTTVKAQTTLAGWSYLQ